MPTLGVHTCMPHYLIGSGATGHETNGWRSPLCIMTYDETGLDRVPNEVLEIVVEYCRQGEVFHLLLTGSRFYELCLTRLYHTVVFDSEHSHFNKEDRFHGTFVRTVGGLRACLRSLDSERALLVKGMECYNSLEIPDLEVEKSFGRIFKLMVNLRRLRWFASPELTVDMLLKIRNASQIKELAVDMALRNDGISRKLADVKFENLTSLCIRPFLNDANLVLIAKSISNSQLRSLELGNSLQTDHEVGSGFAFGIISIGDGMLDSFLTNLTKPLLRLERLVLEDMNIQNPLLLTDYVDLSNLHTFCLVGNPIGRTELTTLLPYFSNRLKAVKIDWPDPTSFIPYLSPLQQLDIVVRHQRDLYSIEQHQQTLSHLAVRTPDNKSNPQLEYCIQSCPYLISLTMPYSTSASHLRPLTNLKYLQLTKARAKPYLGQPTTYLLEDTTRLQILTKQRAAVQPSLRFIKIEGFVFEIKNTRSPINRDGLNLWFDQIACNL